MFGLVWTFIIYLVINTSVYGGKIYDYWKANVAFIMLSGKKKWIQKG